MMKIHHGLEPNREQPKKKQFEEDSLAELAESIKLYGVIQPLIVRKKDDYYEIVAGEDAGSGENVGLKGSGRLLKNIRTGNCCNILVKTYREDLNPLKKLWHIRDY